MRYKTIETNKGAYSQVIAPATLSFMDQPEQTIDFYNTAAGLFQEGKNVYFDLSGVKSLSCDAIAMLISQLKDRTINNGRLSRISPPKDQPTNSHLREWAIFKKVGNTYVPTEGDEGLHKVASYKVTNDTAKAICISASQYLHNKIVRIKELYEVLIECMANTDDHASAQGENKYRWWLYQYANNGIVSVIFLDLGVGIFESLPVRQHIIKRSFRQMPLPSLGATNYNNQNEYLRRLEVNEVFSALMNGKIKSRTGLRERGKGIPLIGKNAKSNIFDKFNIVTNDVHIDLKNDTVTTLNQHLSGTMFCFQVCARGLDYDQR